MCVTVFVLGVDLNALWHATRGCGNGNGPTHFRDFCGHIVEMSIIESWEEIDFPWVLLLNSTLSIKGQTENKVEPRL